MTRRNYVRLAGPKSYAELPYGHWSLRSTFVAEWVNLVARWTRQEAQLPDIDLPHTEAMAVPRTGRLFGRLRP